MDNTENTSTSGDTGNGKLKIFGSIDRDVILKQWKDIKHFTIQEFDSADAPDSGLRMNIEFLKVLESIRKDCGFAFKITSGYRTPSQNALAGGKAGSAHLDGLAADIAITDSSQRFKIIQVALKHGITRIGIAKTFCHIDLDFRLPQSVFWLY